MRTWGMAVVLAGALAAVGCSGEEAPADDDGVNRGGDVPVDSAAPAGPCSDIPSYDIASLGCTQLTTAFETSLASADSCEVAADCKVVRAACESWSGVTCFYAVNTCVSDQLVAEYNQKAVTTGCLSSDDGGYCNCGAPPAVDCLGGRCEFVFE